MPELTAEQIQEIKRILAARVEEYQVLMFGSRLKGKARPFSDLDLAVKGSQALDPKRLAQLKDDFAASNLPVVVDVLDWYALSPEFQKIILEKYEVIQKGSREEIIEKGPSAPGS